MMKKKNRKKGSTTKEIIFIILKETNTYTHTYRKVHTDTRRLTLRTFSTLTHILGQVERFIKTVL